MHMSDALITPLVGGSALLASVGVMKHATDKLETEYIEKKLPYMGVVGAFVFASQMINFAIPGTGSSGHIGGGILLTVLLGPHAGFLTMASILLVQALFFADGGLLAFGCNVLNLGLFTCYVAYPLIYRPLTRTLNGKNSVWRIYLASVTACVVGLQLGSLGVVFETVISNRTELPLMTFLTFMQPIHLAIGLIEGVITATVIIYLFKQRDNMSHDIFKEQAIHGSPSKKKTFRTALIVTLIIGGFISQFASSSPDGLEWSVEKASASTEQHIETEEIEVVGIERAASKLQDSVSIMPDYGFKSMTGTTVGLIGTGVSGVFGSLGVLFIVIVAGSIFRHFKKRKSK